MDENITIFRKCGTYDQVEVFNSITSALEPLGGIGRFVKPGQKVLLKPNILAGYSPDKAVTTNPEVIRAIIRLVRLAGAHAFVGESPGFGTAEKMSKITGIKKVLDEEKVDLIEFKTPKEVNFPDGKKFKRITVAAEVYGYDVLINIPKFKTHVLTGTTNAVKNLFGCVPGLLKSQYHYKIKEREPFIELLEDLARLIKPKLTIMDAVLAMEGEGGPAGGTPRHLGIIGATSDPFDIDQLMLKIINGENIQGFSCPDFKKINILPSNVEFLPLSFLLSFINKNFSDKPVIDPKKCVNCKICINVCAAKAMSVGSKNPVYDYGKCIRCFCCQEMCPERAIFVKKNMISDLLAKIFNRK
ncbi:DUF362 domain-containing protein [Candidatus Saganbacteria bacterium]|nr:DUF362 domain-containing protein [Candidatus Saganbacteria bacterium]